MNSFPERSLESKNFQGMTTAFSDLNSNPLCFVWQGVSSQGWGREEEKSGSIAKAQASPQGEESSGVTALRIAHSEQALGPERP